MKQPLLSIVVGIAYMLGCCQTISAQQPGENSDVYGKILRPVISAFTIESGSAHNADTYLTPLHYTGWNMALGYEHLQATGFDPYNWVRQFYATLYVDRTMNPARNAAMWDGFLHFRWTMMHRWQDIAGVRNLTVAAGPGVGLRAGILYLSRNGNNPAAAKGAFTLDSRWMAAYSLKIGHLPVTFRYQGALPVTGAFFSPHYGQLYYEIWLGERHGLVRAAWPGNYFALDSRVTADLRLGGTTLRLGYHNYVQSTKVSGIVYRQVSHAFTLGIVTEWLSLSTRPAKHSKTVSALYPAEY